MEGATTKLSHGDELSQERQLEDLAGPGAGPLVEAAAGSKQRGETTGEVLLSHLLHLATAHTHRGDTGKTVGRLRQT